MERGGRRAVLRTFPSLRDHIKLRCSPKLEGASTECSPLQERVGAESQSAVMSCAWFEDRMVATGGDDGVVRVYNSGELKVRSQIIAGAQPLSSPAG